RSGCHSMGKKLLIIFSVIVLFIVGYFILNAYQKKRLVSEAKEKAEEYVMENYEDVESVQITPDNYRITPMGTIGVGGHINNEDKLYFYVTFLIENNILGEFRTIVEAHDFPDRKDGE